MAVVSVEKLAQAMNVTPRRVQQLVDEGLPREERGRYDLGKSMAWYIRYLQGIIERRDIPQADGVQAAFWQEKRRLTEAQADLAQLAVAQRRGELLPVAFFERLMVQMITQGRQQLLQLPDRVAPELEGESRATIKTKLVEAIHRALAALAESRIDILAIQAATAAIEPPPLEVPKT